MKALWFVLLNFVALAGVVGTLLLVPSDTSLLSFFGISVIAIGFLNCSLAILMRLRNRTVPDEVKRRAWKELRWATVMSGAWVLLIAQGTYGLVLAAVTALVLLVVGLAIWIAKKSVPSE